MWDDEKQVAEDDVSDLTDLRTKDNKMSRNDKIARKESTKTYTQRTTWKRQPANHASQAASQSLSKPTTTTIIIIIFCVVAFVTITTLHKHDLLYKSKPTTSSNI
ncbi:hypothetical protein DOY81_014517 [Sarcophaga bullata]|nr:hypothetical protein DOY81_014517 [Sarcophaga bullata]